MATAERLKNGKVAADMADVANKAAVEAKEIVDSVIEATNKAVADTKPMLEAQQKMMETSFGIWFQASENYLNFVTSASKQVMGQTLGFQKEMFDVAQDGVKKMQDLWVAEQAFALENAESLQAQMKATSERMAKMFAPVFPVH